MRERRSLRQRWSWRAPDDGDIDLDSEFVSQAIELAQDYGNFTATGVREEAERPTEEQWRSSLEGQVAQTSTAADPTTGEATPEGLKETLQQELEEE